MCWLPTCETSLIKERRLIAHAGDGVKKHTQGRQKHEPRARQRESLLLSLALLLLFFASILATLQTTPPQLN